jgi:hypothetical protein
MSPAIATPRLRYPLVALLGAALVGVVLLALPATGQAHQDGPPEDDCEPAPNVNIEGWGDACFEVIGDAHWVRDQTRNHWSVRVQIQTDYGKIRWCANTHRADSWHRCNFNHREESCVRWRMFEQREIPPQVGTTRKWTDWSAWHHAGTGAADITCNDLRPPRGDCFPEPVPGDGAPLPGPYLPVPLPCPDRAAGR